jgi:23S rRNA pseudouridine1911/1915/1917 synthase
MPKLPPLEVLYEDNHLLVVNKPAGLPTQGVVEGASSVVTLAKAYLKRKYKKPGNVYLGVVSRLDAWVSGVLVLARTSKAAARLTEQFREHKAEKIYWALVERKPDPPAGELSHWLRKDDRQRRMEVVPPRTRGAQHARLSYQTLSAEKQGTLVEVRLHTGRKHQIRLQLAAIGSPILGDAKYGSHKPFAAHGIALHSARLTIEHPTSKERLEFRAPPPKEWKLKTG